MIGGHPGWLHEAGAPASGGTVATGGIIFDAAVVYGDRGYQFTLDGNVDRALFDALLASVTFDADSAIDLPPLTTTFTSPTYGYTIGIGEGFLTTPATSKWTPGVNAGESPQDVIGTMKNDWFVQIGSVAIPAGTTFDEWLAVDDPPSDGRCGVHQRGSSPGRQSRSGTEVPIVLTYCLDSALVGEGGRAYEFDWSIPGRRAVTQGRLRSRCSSRRPSTPAAATP